MAREKKDTKPTPKTGATRKCAELSDWLLRKLCDEEVFPKRSRWLMSGKIADLMNNVEINLHLANELMVVTPEERDKRHLYLVTARAYLQALDIKVNQAQRILNIPEQTFYHYARLVNDLNAFIMSWINSDIKRFGMPTGISDKGSGYE